MTKLRLTITVEYEADPTYYGTTDPVKMAEIDQSNFRDDPDNLMELIDSDNTTITVALAREL